MRFEKIWRVRNGGSCSWGSGYRLAFLIGNRMDGPEIQDVGPVPPGGLAEIGASLVAPRTSGTYAALWQMVNARGEAFGHKLSVIVQVPPPETPLPPLPAPTLVPVAGKTRTRPADGMVVVYVPVGEFQMGSNDGPKDERPVHTIVLDGFWLDRTEVTNAQYHRCVMAGACAVSRYKDDPRYNGDSQPVVGVSWDDAVAYSEWAGARLPTEAEWEFAARGPEDRVFPWGNTFDGLRLNYCDINCREEPADRKTNDGHAYTAPVGSYPSGVSWCGALDLAGNVWEWVADWYGAYPAERQINPTGPASGTSRVLRGGSWITGPDLVRCAARYGINAILPADWLDFVGFRCASSSP